LGRLGEIDEFPHMTLSNHEKGQPVMEQKENLVADVVKAEWKMFQDVPSIGGKASCQEDSKTFGIMRSSQLISWSEAVLESYLSDLKEADISSRNLLTEKYARMMESTSPSEYARIEHLLPPIDPRAPELIDQIVAIVLEWEMELAKKFPHILKRGRPISSTEDRPRVTSLETYLRGELATYSLRTLDLYLANVMQQKSEGINGSEITLMHTTKQYGYNSLEKANEKLQQRA
jgi:hypothetical protein